MPAGTSGGKKVRRWLDAEYAVVLGVITVAVVGVLGVLSGKVQGAFQSVVDAM